MEPRRHPVHHHQAHHDGTHGTAVGVIRACTAPVTNR